MSELDSAGNNCLLDARGISREFQTSEGPLEVLRGIDLQVYQGDMMAVVGESGVGKSTLLHILGGLDRPDSGEITLMGELILERNEAEMAIFRNRHVGFVFQHHYLLEDFTAMENVMMPALIAGLSVTEATRRAEQLLAEVGLSDRMKHRPRQLSGGEQQRVAVARALVNEPGLVIADEPSGNLDLKNGEKLHKLLSQLNNSRGTTFLLATHNLDLARSCRKMVMLEYGRVKKIVVN